MARVLLDESIPRQLGPALEGHEVQTVPQIGWAGISNGELLRRAEEQLDVLVTGDQNLQYQQNLAAVNLGLVVVAALDTRVSTVLLLAPQIAEAIADVEPGSVKVVVA